MERILEPEVMDSAEEAIEYDAMDFTEVNSAFAQEAIALGSSEETVVLDAGTGTARIPILMCQMRPNWQVVAVDLAASMLEIASSHVQEAGLQNQIRLELVDVKHMPYADGQFDMVVSNSLVHHLPNPLSLFRELKRVLKPNGGIFIRDLFRPQDEATMNALVDSIGTEYNEHQKKLFRDSLHAALTINEVKDLLSEVGLQAVEVYQSSDRHWTAERRWNCERILSF
ncbi:methyltransferase [Hapalosiphon sp. MRB220]|nr:methyltransferase [Hapalosiphon sp. MRB220]